jgi:hypothetical protein
VLLVPYAALAIGLLEMRLHRSEIAYSVNRRAQ